MWTRRDLKAKGKATFKANYWKTCPRTTLEASGEAVGLPAGQMGNSEVGHLNIGAGRVVHQELTRINAACADGSIARSEGVQAAFEAASTPGSALHLMGLFSDGGVHSHITHLLALIRHAVAAGVPDVRVHCFMDGRDVSPTSGIGFVRELETMSEEHDWCDRVRIELPHFSLRNTNNTAELNRCGITGISSRKL